MSGLIAYKLIAEHHLRTSDVLQWPELTTLQNVFLNYEMLSQPRMNLSFGLWSVHRCDALQVTCLKLRETELESVLYWVAKNRKSSKTLTRSVKIVIGL